MREHRCSAAAERRAWAAKPANCSFDNSPRTAASSVAFAVVSREIVIAPPLGSSRTVDRVQHRAPGCCITQLTVAAVPSDEEAGAARDEDGMVEEPLVVAGRLRVGCIAASNALSLLDVCLILWSRSARPTTRRSISA